MTANTGFDTRTYKVRLDDYHPGEYTHFSDWARRRAELDDSYRADGAARGETTPWDNMPTVTAELIERTDEQRDAANHDEDYMDYWVLRGTANQLRELYHELLKELATPAWHWYGMGGDDHAYDYWPNTMGLAVEFRDQLLRIAEAENSPGFKDPYHTTYLVEDLNRVYWGCRLRYEADARKVNADVGAVLVDDDHFDDFLNAEHFGPRP